jgi:hypothetical protein
MTKFTKADIDALVDGLYPAAGRDEIWGYTFEKGGPCIDQRFIRKGLYLAAGLTADGQPKPEKVRCYAAMHTSGERYFYGHFPGGHVFDGAGNALPIVSGWFVPDGAA